MVEGVTVTLQPPMWRLAGLFHLHGAQPPAAQAALTLPGHMLHYVHLLCAQQDDVASPGLPGAGLGLHLFIVGGRLGHSGLG
jgi:hypothetical protein